MAAPALATIALPAGAAAASHATTPIAPPAANGVVASKAATKAGQVAQAKPAHTPEQAKAVLDQIRVQILDGKREARIQLRPIELGRLDLLIRVDGGDVSARIGVETPEALSVLESHAPELRAWLSRDGAENVEVELYLMDPEGDAQRDGSSGASSDTSSGTSSGTPSGADHENQRSGERRSDPSLTPDPATIAGLNVPAGLAGGVDFVA